MDKADMLDPEAPMCACGHTVASHSPEGCFACAGPPCGVDYIRYTIDLTPEAWVALERHGYDPALPPRGRAGGPGRMEGRYIKEIDGRSFRFPVRNRVCFLDGIEIDGHEGSDLDPTSTSCIHCDYEGPNP